MTLELFALNIKKALKSLRVNKEKAPISIKKRGAFAKLYLGVQKVH
ncbi:hypothetical protein [Bacillus thuringiensis]|nr:hypothetical protein [Bacillus thuringiensis]